MKFNKWIVLGISLLVTLIAGLLIFFLLVKKRQDQIADINTAAAGIEQAGGTQQALMQEQNKLKQTNKNVVKTTEDWQINEAKYMPGLPFNKSETSADIIDIYENKEVKGYHGFKDLPTAWGTWITKWYEKQHLDGVDLLPGQVFAIPSFPTDPNFVSTISNSIPLPEAGKPWVETVECKSFEAAMRHLNRINNMTRHGMPVVSNVAMTGQSPNLLLTYDLMLYIIPGSKPPPLDSRLETTSAAPAGGGMGGFGGGPGGYGPPGMTSSSMPPGMTSSSMPPGMTSSSMPPGAMGNGK